MAVRHQLEIQAYVAEHAGAIETIRAQHAAQLSDVESTHSSTAAAATDALAARHAAQLAELNGSIEDIRSSHASALEEVAHAEASRAKTALANQEASHTERLEELNAAAAAERQALEANHGASIEILNGKVATLEAELIERASMLDRTSQELTTARSDHAAKAASLEVVEAQLHHEKEVADARAREAADALGRLEAAAAEKLAAVTERDMAVNAQDLESKELIDSIQASHAKTIASLKTQSKAEADAQRQLHALESNSSAELANKVKGMYQQQVRGDERRLPVSTVH